jgi:hypothetical protein
MDLTGPFEVFARIPGATVHILAESLEPLQDAAGLVLTPTQRLSDKRSLDLFFLPGGAFGRYLEAARRFALGLDKPGVGLTLVEAHLRCATLPVDSVPRATLRFALGLSRKIARTEVRLSERPKILTPDVLILRSRSSLFKRDKEHDMATRHYNQTFGRTRELHRTSIWSDLGLIILSATTLVSISFGFTPGSRSSQASLLPGTPLGSEDSSVEAKSIIGNPGNDVSSWPNTIWLRLPRFTSFRTASIPPTPSPVSSAGHPWQPSGTIPAALVVPTSAPLDFQEGRSDIDTT